MDPQQQPAIQPNSTPAPVPPAPETPPVPQPSPAPPTVQTPMPVTPTVVVPGPPLTLPQTGKKSRRGLILGIVGGIVVILVVIILLVALPNLQANKVSSNFMHDITAGNVSAAAALTDGGSSNNAFLQDAAKNVKGSYSLKSDTVQNSQHYYLYTLTNSTDKYARTILKKESGGWKVTSFVFGGTPLALVPSKTSNSNVSTSSTQSSSTSTGTNDCLIANDFTPFSNLGTSMFYHNSNGTYQDTFQLEFNPNDATYAAGDVPDPTALFNDYKNFYAQSGSKKYSIELESSVNSSSPDETLANARNAQVQSDLETSGIPASKISIQPITNDTTDSDTGDAFFRQVQITLMSDSSCATS